MKWLQLKKAALHRDGGRLIPQETERGYVYRRQHARRGRARVKTLVVVGAEFQIVRSGSVERAGHIERSRISERNPRGIHEEEICTRNIGPDQPTDGRRSAGYPADHVVDRARARERCALCAAQIELQETMKQIRAVQLPMDLTDDEIVGVAAKWDVLPQGPVTYDLCRGGSDQADRTE